MSQHPLISKIEQHMVLVEGGTFMMGSEEYGHERPVHEVELDNFYISRYLVTQEIWEEVMEENPAQFSGSNTRRPVESISWHQCQKFLKKLNELSDYSYRLPTEAEWEYAARGGRYRSLLNGKIDNLTYAGSNYLEEVAWWDENSHEETQPVGRKRPNALGIYDMSGNVDEWCQDWYDRDYYQSCVDNQITNNPPGPTSGGTKVVRGGSWFNSMLTITSASPFASASILLLTAITWVFVSCGTRFRFPLFLFERSEGIIGRRCHPFGRRPSRNFLRG